MYMNFNEFLEDKHPEYLDEGIGSWVGNKLGQGVDAVGRGVGRMANAAVSGAGAGAMAGMKRAGNVMMQGQDSNASQQMGLMAQKAAMSGDPENWKQVSAQIYKQMSQERRPAQDNMRQRHPAQDDIDKAKIHDYDQQRSDDSFAPKNPSNFARSRSI
jgi:hypothetical protein